MRSGDSLGVRPAGEVYVPDWLGPEDHLLEIGTGWGGFAVHAADRFGCRVTTTTI